MINRRKIAAVGGAILTLGLVSAGCTQTKAKSPATVTEAKSQQGAEPCSIVLAVTGMT